ncbi:MAG: DUF1217 domain-containing protein [Pseudomonadota bacterium]
MFQPVLPLPGVAGWRFLEATEANQRAAFDRSPALEREITYFNEKISEITSAEELVQDRTLRKVALGAFGLDEDLFKIAFVEKILAEGTENDDALANRFVDPRYAEFSQAFGFGDSFGPRTQEFGFGQRITDQYRDRQFEVAVGEVDQNMRLALTLRREIETYANSATADDTQWFRILGSTPLRTVFEVAFNLPSAFGGLDVDQQREVLQDRTRDLFGDSSLSVFQDPEAVDTLLNRFLVRQQITEGPGPGTPGVAALTLLQNASAPSTGLTNLILSGT